MKNILVFGGNGFLGHYLVHELINRGYNVTVADLIDKKEYGDYISFIKCDILNREEVANVFNESKFDIIYNFAGFADRKAHV